MPLSTHSFEVIPHRPLPLLRKPSQSPNAVTVKMRLPNGAFVQGDNRATQHKKRQAKRLSQTTLPSIQQRVSDSGTSCYCEDYVTQYLTQTQ